MAVAWTSVVAWVGSKKVRVEWKPANGVGPDATRMAADRAGPGHTAAARPARHASARWARSARDAAGVDRPASPASSVSHRTGLAVAVAVAVAVGHRAGSTDGRRPLNRPTPGRYAKTGPARHAAGPNRAARYTSGPDGPAGPVSHGAASTRLTGAAGLAGRALNRPTDAGRRVRLVLAGQTTVAAPLVARLTRPTTRIKEGVGPIPVTTTRRARVEPRKPVAWAAGPTVPARPLVVPWVGTKRVVWVGAWEATEPAKSPVAAVSSRLDVDGRPFLASREAMEGVPGLEVAS